MSSPWTKLNEQEVERVLKAVERGTPTKTIAAHWGVSDRTIQRIAKASRAS